MLQKNIYSRNILFYSSIVCILEPLTDTKLKGSRFISFCNEEIGARNIAFSTSV